MSSNTFLPSSLIPSRLLTTEVAEYSCMFTNRWSAARHPSMYPSNAHWSPPVLAAHNEEYQIWGPGLNATAGIERVAEVGNTQQLVSEIEAASTESNSTGTYVQGSVTFNSVTQEQVFPLLTMDPEFPFLSTISMIADSPDWFSGFYDFDCRYNAEFVNPSWFRSFSIDTYPWDAGTEQGDTYQLGNPPQQPPLPITQLTVDTVPPTGVFLSPDSTTVLPVATWTCELMNEPVCLDRGNPCETNIQCCSSRCSLGSCLPTRPTTDPKDAAKLSDGRGGAGGGGGGGRQRKRKLRGL